MIRVISVLYFLLFLAAASFAQWSQNPAVNNEVCIALRDQSFSDSYTYFQAIASDGAGGAIIAWEDHRNSDGIAPDTADIYAQRIDSLGATLWPANGVPICTAAGNQQEVSIISDGAGGAIMTWTDARNGGDFDIYSQRIDGNGVRQWATGGDSNGIAICTLSQIQAFPSIVSDGAGGAMIAWYDLRINIDGNIFAQRINASGVVQWSANGVPVTKAPEHQVTPVMASDGSGGAIIAWMDYRISGSPDTTDIYAQRLNSTGVRQWIVGSDSNGVPVSTASNYQYYPVMVEDGAGGVIIAWEDRRLGTAQADIYAQRLSAGGARQWIVGSDSNGVAVCTSASFQGNPMIVSDGAGGALMTWADARGASEDIYAQRIDGSGIAQWMSDGVSLSMATSTQFRSTIASDGAGGAIVTWEDRRLAGNSNIYAQRITAAGNVPWLTLNGTAISTASFNQKFPILVPAGTKGGAVIVWQDRRSSTNEDVYAQWVDSNGQVGGGPWITKTPSTLHFGEVPVDSSKIDSITYTNTGNGQLILSDFFSFSPDFTIPSSTDTLAPGASKRYYVTFSPQSPGEKANTILCTSNAPNASYFFVYGKGMGAEISLSPPYGFFFGFVPLHSMREDSVMVMNSGTQSLEITSITTSSPDLIITPASGSVPPSDTGTFHLTYGPSSEYFNRVDTLTFFHNAPGSPSKILVFSSNMFYITDSVQDGWNMVSLPFSVLDYRPPNNFGTGLISPAFAYAGQYQVRDTLQKGPGYWMKFNGDQVIYLYGAYNDRETVDVSTGWNIIGSTVSPISVQSIGSIPGGMVTSNFFGYANGYQVADSIRPGNGYWVKVNQNGKLTFSVPPAAGYVSEVRDRIHIIAAGERPPGPPDSELSNSASAIPGEFSLGQNYPNPFNPATVIRYQLPVSSRVTLNVYNVLGQEVATLVDEMQEAGYRSVRWDAGKVAGGMYFYKLTAGSFIEVKKMMIIK